MFVCPCFKTKMYFEILQTGLSYIETLTLYYFCL
jgi:hypothetical protein